MAAKEAGHQAFAVDLGKTAGERTAAGWRAGGQAAPPGPWIPGPRPSEGRR